MCLVESGLTFCFKVLQPSVIKFIAHQTVDQARKHCPSGGMCQNVRMALNFKETGCQGERLNAVIVTQRGFSGFLLLVGHNI